MPRAARLGTRRAPGHSAAPKAKLIAAFLASRTVRGFTLIELVAVLVIAAVLAIVATSLFDRRSFATAAFTDQTRAQVAYAQRVAVGARRTVTVTVSGGNTVALTMCADAACTSAVPVPSPQGETGFTRIAPSGVTIAPDGSFSFDPLGATPSTRTLNITGDVVRTVTIEAITGYVR